jgi:hypothetical protein
MVEMTFKNVRLRAGRDVTLDLEVRPGTADLMDVTTELLNDRPLYSASFLSNVTAIHRGMRLSTDRPVFHFKHMGKVVANVQVDFRSGRPQVFGKVTGAVTVR